MLSAQAIFGQPPFLSNTPTNLLFMATPVGALAFMVGISLILWERHPDAKMSSARLLIDHVTFLFSPGISMCILRVRHCGARMLFAQHQVGMKTQSISSAVVSAQCSSLAASVLSL